MSLALAVGLSAAAAGVPARAAGDGIAVSAEAAAARELLEGANGRQEAWKTVPELVVLGAVMQFAATDASAGYVATDQQLTEAETQALTADMNQALADLTGGMMPDFAASRVEHVSAGQTAKVFRRGQIVVGRFRSVQAQTGSLGYGGRTTRTGVITSAAVFLDSDFDQTSSQRRLLRTHELGHALGYNHVESRRSVMNPRVGSDLTDFDRRVIRLAFPGPVESGPLALSAVTSRSAQN